MLQYMQDTGGFCLPDFVKEGVSTWFAIDNIDLLEDTPNGQNTIHGTVIVINQRVEEGEVINQPPKLPSPILMFDGKYLDEPFIRSKPMKFEAYEFGKRQDLMS